MKADEVMADFQIVGSRVASLTLKTQSVEAEPTARTDFDIDYKIKESYETEDKFVAVLALLVKVRATVGKKVMFKIALELEGLFAARKNKLAADQFLQMLELNGVIALMHLARAYLLTVTSQSGITPPVRLPMINILKLREKKQLERQRDNG